jgi:tRNA(fMet)-specific endonuclease VapC
VRIALDTNRYVDFCKGVPEVVDRLRRVEWIGMPLVVLAELRAGFLCGDRSAANERNLIAFLDSPRVEVVYPDDATTHHYARLYRQLREQGTPIPTNDLWIAALVLENDLQLFARDSHFDRLPQLPRV